MKEILLTSSALILALLALRRLFRRTLSRRAQYALWGLVLVRLLVPANLPAAGFSLLTAAKPAADRVESLYIAPDSVTTWRTDGGPLYGVQNPPQAAIGPATPDNTYTFSYQNAMGNPAEGIGTYQRQILLSDLLRPVWYGGTGIMACWLVLSNLLFWRKLREARTPYPVEGSPRRVYLVERGLPSPCLFGLFRPAVYLTPAALQSPDRLRHVLAHEETHARHLDPLWSLLRGVCLAVYWFDPLVWWAALASRADCELACDEGALRRLGEAERVPYGRTLLSLIPVRKTPANPLLSATTMTAGKRQLRDRVTRIAENRTCLGRTLFAAAALAALVCAVTFTGAKKPEEPARFHGVEEAAAALAEELENYGGPDGDIMSKLIVYTPESPPEHFDLKEGELLRVYWGMSYSLSASRSDPMGWLCSLYRLGPEPDYLDRSMEILGGDGQYRYGLLHPDWAPEIKEGRTEGMSLMNRITGRVREAVLSCGSLITEARPNWDPVHTIPLDDAEPYEPQAAELPFPYGYRQMLGGLEDPEHVLGDYGLLFFEGGDSATGGEVFAGVQHLARSSWPQPFWSFRPGAGGKYSASLFRNLLGHDGFCITYNANDRDRTLTNAYYYLNEEGRPVLLAQVTGWPKRIDLDGDGVDELSSRPFMGPYQLYFRRGDRHYRADLADLLGTVWPAGTDFCFDDWDPAARAMPFRAQVSPSPSYEYRTLYFDGENLLIYNDQRHFTDHMIEWFDEDSRIKDAARTAVEEIYSQANLPYSLDSVYPSRCPYYDDWRITDIGEGYGLEVDGTNYILRRVCYEFHTPEPRDAPELGEGARDHWAAPSSESLWLVFRGLSRYRADLTYLFSFRQEGDLVLSPEFLREKLREADPGKPFDIYLGTAVLKAESSVGTAADPPLLDGP